MSAEDSISLADEARTLRERVAARLAELEPLVREYEELQRVAAEIGLAPPARTSLKPPEPVSARTASNGDQHQSTGDEKRPASGQRRSTRATARRRQARRGQSRTSAAAERDARVLEAVAAHPGATVAEIAAVLGVDAVSLYRPVRDLASAGKIAKRARGLFPATG